MVGLALAWVDAPAVFEVGSLAHFGGLRRVVRSGGRGVGSGIMAKRNVSIYGVFSMVRDLAFVYDRASVSLLI